VQERLRGIRGVVVTRLTPNALASDKVKPGDLIFAVNGARIGSANEFFLHLAASAAVQSTALQLLREGQEMRVDLPALPRKEDEQR
jgi:S1-C subfamily serine protease